VREIYDFSVIIDGNGSVNGNSSNFTLSPDSATQVSLTAVSQAGWDFERWYGYAVSDPAASSITFIPTAIGSLTATFERNSYDLTVTNSAGGEANGTGTYLYDSAISIQASPSPGYMFVKWTGNTELIDEFNPMVTLRIPDQNISLYADDSTHDHDIRSWFWYGFFGWHLRYRFDDHLKCHSIGDGCRWSKRVSIGKMDLVLFRRELIQ
jgi:hypothetical protein